MTRDEIRDRVWPKDSVQDFDNSLRVAVAKLRQAFGDDADNPRYIETLPRRGYRWLHPVTVHDTQPNLAEAVDDSARATRQFRATCQPRTSEAIEIDADEAFTPHDFGETHRCVVVTLASGNGRSVVVFVLSSPYRILVCRL